MSQADFDKAGEDAKHPKTKSADNAMTFPYSRYKQLQMTQTAWPGLSDLKGKARWDAWNQLKGTSKEDAIKASTK
ncbi:acyl-CoA-binding protein-like [Panthera uncia]|uniref:acyl-CoA-binding protein-like n=1 Tax=Panthera uncia TaxID=29064 RepID=UPI0020FFEB58|nr:acyl-CoA-binding protein-like [Panthera uncia]